MHGCLHIADILLLGPGQQWPRVSQPSAVCPADCVRCVQCAVPFAGRTWRFLAGSLASVSTMSAATRRASRELGLNSTRRSQHVSRKLTSMAACVVRCRHRRPYFSIRNRARTSERCEPTARQVTERQCVPRGGQQPLRHRLLTVPLTVSFYSNCKLHLY